MRQITIDGGEITGRENLHDVLKRTLELPEWYGRNLDALYDCLTAEPTEETEILVTNCEALEENLGTYGKVFLRLLEEAEEETSRLRVRFE